jgi:hypothetical protein
MTRLTEAYPARCRGGAVRPRALSVDSLRIVRTVRWLGLGDRPRHDAQLHRRHTISLALRPDRQCLRGTAPAAIEYFRSSVKLHTLILGMVHEVAQPIECDFGQGACWLEERGRYGALGIARLTGFPSIDPRRCR